MKEGYQSTKKQDLKVVKKKSNILDKAPARKTVSDKTDGGAGANDDDVAPLPPAGMTAQELQKMEDLMLEMNKLKAIVLKHEVRIRDLEKTLTANGITLSSDNENDSGKTNRTNNGDTAH